MMLILTVISLRYSTSAKLMATNLSRLMYYIWEKQENYVHFGIKADKNLHT